MADKPVRRGKKNKSDDLPPSDLSMTDAFFPGGDEPTQAVADTEPPAPAKPRRGRKAEERLELVSPEPEQSVASSDEDEPAVEPDAAPSSVAAADAASSAAAAKYDAETGTATFDWPAIEAVAATGGANQAMAKLLLAARAEGANSRWPF